MGVGRLLIIDDESGLAKVLARLAAQIGLEARTVTDPLEALAAFRDFKPDLTMIDMIMPGRDGIDVAQEILLSGIPTAFIFMSGYGEGHLRLASALATKFHGAQHVRVLHKPFRRDEVRQLLEDVMRSVRTLE